MPTPKIRILNQNTIEKIAAGEMIERPVSAVKELVENAVDAGAPSISVHLRRGGMEYIQVVDDGCGMSKEDAELCVLRHATSKIQSIEDLEKLGTLGFRGEALASIANVSLFALETCTGEDAAVMVEVEGGKLKGVSSCGRAKGTTVIVRELFYNTPARRKFLKSERSELAKISEMLEETGLLHPEIAFSLFHHGRKLIDLPVADSSRERIVAIFGKDIASSCISFDHSNNGVRFHGFLGHPQIARSNTKSQYLFVNKRPVLHRPVQQAMRRAYGNLLPGDRFALFVVSLDMDPQMIDVNVHPTKREVRISNEPMVLDIVYSSVSKTLRESGFSAASYSATRESAFSMPQPIDFKEPAPDEIKEIVDLFASASAPLEKSNSAPLSPGSSALAKQDVLEKEAAIHVSYFQLHRLYILSQIKNGLLLIDQHAAHERILYEKAREDLRRPSAVSQQLLFPVVVEFSMTQFQVLESMLPFFGKLGFDLKPFGGASMLVQGIPPQVAFGAAEKTLRDMVDYLMENEETGAAVEDRMAKSFACGAAIKAGQELSQEEMASLVDMLFLAQSPYTCPHGRPTLVRLSLDDIAKRFLR